MDNQSSGGGAGIVQGWTTEYGCIALGLVTDSKGSNTNWDTSMTGALADNKGGDDFGGGGWKGTHSSALGDKEGEYEGTASNTGDVSITNGSLGRRPEL